MNSVEAARGRRAGDRFQLLERSREMRRRHPRRCTCAFIVELGAVLMRLQRVDEAETAYRGVLAID